MVEEKGVADGLLEVLSDTYSRKIFLSTRNEPKTVEEISHENGIPISTCYRRVHELIQLRMLRIVSTIITPEGKKYGRYACAIGSVKVSLSSGSLTIDIEPVSPAPEEKLHDMWLSMKREGGLNMLVHDGRQGEIVTKQNCSFGVN